MKLYVAVFLVFCFFEKGKSRHNCQGFDESYELDGIYIDVRKLFNFLILVNTRNKDVLELMEDCGTISSIPVYKDTEISLENFKKDCRIFENQLASIKEMDMNVSNASKNEKVIMKAIQDVSKIVQTKSCSMCPCIIDKFAQCVSKVGSLNEQNICETRKTVNINLGGENVGKYLSDKSNRVYVWGNTSSISVEASKIVTSNTEYGNVMRTNRFSNNNWGLIIQDISSGLYDCDLHFADIRDPLSRIESTSFYVKINGERSEDINIFEVTEEFKPFKKKIKNVKVPWNGVNSLEVSVFKLLSISETQQYSFLSAVSCSKSFVNQFQEIVNINMGGPSYRNFISDVDKRVIHWGDTSTVLKNASGFNDHTPFFLLSERYGFEEHWGFTVEQVQPGGYECILHFIVDYIPTSSKIFSVGINGKYVYDIDVFKFVGSHVPFESNISDINVPWLKRNVIQVSLTGTSGNPFLHGLSCRRVKKPSNVPLPSIDINIDEKEQFCILVRNELI